MAQPAAPEFADPEHTCLRAVLARLIPADDWPGALEAGVDRYVVHQLAHAWAGRRAEVAAGLSSLDHAARHVQPPGNAGVTTGAPRDAEGGTFASLPPHCQDALLRLHEREPWFDLLVNLAAEGFYADPGNGGNADAVSWRMVGYAANRFSFTPPPAALPRRGHRP